MEKRNRAAMFYIEDYLYDKIAIMASRYDMSTSSYIRSVMVRHLMHEGLIPNALKDGLSVGVRPLLEEGQVV